MSLQQVKNLLLLKVKYASASAIATSVDYGLYLLLVYAWLGEEQKTWANFIAYPIGVLVNFGLQKGYVFDMKRRLSTTFIFAMLVSAGGWVLNTVFFFGLMKIPFFNLYHVLGKLLVNAVVFFYNFYGKRYVFEKRFF
ncbi:MAG: GtrA family protein [Bacteroidota bacterium]